MEPSTESRAPGVILALVAVGLTWAVLQLWGLGRTPFHTRGEPREAVVVQDLVAHQHWILPRRNGTQLPRKPPLFYWLGGVAARAQGAVDEFSVRLPSAAQSGAAALLLTATASALLSPLAGGAAGIALLTSFEWLRAGTAARVDMTLSFGLTLVFVGLLLFRHRPRPAWLLLIYLGAAWATLAKGIPGLAIPVIQVALLCALDRGLGPLRSLRPLRGLLVVLLAVGAWYAAAAAQGGRAFLDIVANENLVRIVGAKQANLGHAHGLGYLVGVLLLGLLPWTLLLPSVAAALWRERGGIGRADPRLLALLWSAAVFLPYAVASSKRGVYLLPLYPAVALLVGWWVDRVWRGLARPTLLTLVLRVALWPLALLLALLGIAVVAEGAGLPLLAWLSGLGRGRSAAHVREIVATARAGGEMGPLLLVAAAAATVGALAAGRRQARLMLIALAGLTAAVVLVVRLAIMPAIGAAETRRELVTALRAAVADPAQVHTVPNLDYGTIFYWGGSMPVYDPRDGGDGPPYLLMPEASWVRAPLGLRERYERLPGVRAARLNNDGTPVIVARRAPAEGAAPQPADR